MNHVEDAIAGRLRVDGVAVLVCAAACGADLLALSAAASLGIRRRIVLPFAVDVFRERSVVDRPGPPPWGEMYDRFVMEARASGDLRLLALDAGAGDAFETANEAILDEALAVASDRGEPAEAIVVWDASARTAHDYTEHFAQQAERRGMPVKSVSILP